MHKILLIIKREYFARVRNRSFVIITLIAPILFAIIFKLFDSPINSTQVNSANSLLIFISIFSSILIYMVIFFYSIRTMQGVMEEKSNRIIEVIISSVRPFQLMMGKIIGITAVVFTQIAAWAFLTVILAYAINNFQTSRDNENLAQTSVVQQNSSGTVSKDVESRSLSASISSISTMTLLGVFASFIFYLFGGFVLYGALFAAIGAAVDSDTDSMQFMIPVTIPLIFALIVVPSVFKNPHNDVAFWTSLIPFTSPVVMMMRIPFGVPWWQLGLSMILLITGFLATTYLAAKIYKIGILAHGAKINLRTLKRWLLTSG